MDTKTLLDYNRKLAKKIEGQTPKPVMATAINNTLVATEPEDEFGGNDNNRRVVERMKTDCEVAKGKKPVTESKKTRAKNAAEVKAATESSEASTTPTWKPNA